MSCSWILSKQGCDGRRRAHDHGSVAGHGPGSARGDGARNSGTSVADLLEIEASRPDLDSGLHRRGNRDHSRAVLADREGVAPVPRSDCPSGLRVDRVGHSRRAAGCFAGICGDADRRSRAHRGLRAPGGRVERGSRESAVPVVSDVGNSAGTLGCGEGFTRRPGRRQGRGGTGFAMEGSHGHAVGR